MLGRLVGQDKVMVSVTADLDFTQENREEKLVEPVDKDNMQGIAVSAEKLMKHFLVKMLKMVALLEQEKKIQQITHLVQQVETETTKKMKNELIMK